MRLQKAQDFFSHIQSALKGKEPSSYALSCPIREERRTMIEKLVLLLQKKYKASPAVYHEAEEVSWAEISGKLNTPSFLCTKEIFIWDGVKTLSEKQREAVLRYIQNPSESGIFILGAETFKGISELSKSEQIVILDLTEEKPWDKQKRLEQEIVQRAVEANKKISPEAIETLLSKCGEETSVLDTELAKCICYVGDRPHIQKQDILAIGSFSAVANGWQIADSLIWGVEVKAAFPPMDLSFILSLLGQVRYQLMQGLQIALHLQRGEDQIAKALPSIRPAQLQKMIAKVKQRPKRYFHKALSALFEVELLVKNSSLSPSIIWGVLSSKLLFLQTYDR